MQIGFLARFYQLYPLQAAHTHKYDICFWYEHRQQFGSNLRLPKLIAHTDLSGHGKITSQLTQPKINSYLATALNSPGPTDWILLNEYFADDGNRRIDAFGELPLFWPQELFIAANQINPGVNYWISDYQLEKRSLKWQAYKQLLSQMPVKPYGIALQLQSHLAPLPNFKALSTLVDEIHGMGLKCMFSEVICWAYPRLPGCDRIQAGIYKQWLAIARKKQVEAFIFWAPLDGYGWYPTHTHLDAIGLLPTDTEERIKLSHPGLWDSQGKPKQAAFAVFGEDVGTVDPELAAPKIRTMDPNP